MLPDAGAPVQKAPGEAADVEPTRSKLDDDLVAAIVDGDTKKVADLLAKGANINATDRYKSTPLMQAVAVGSEAMIGLLLDKGADANAKDKDGFYAAFNCLLFGPHGGGVAAAGQRRRP